MTTDATDNQQHTFVRHILAHIRETMDQPNDLVITDCHVISMPYTDGIVK